MTKRPTAEISEAHFAPIKKFCSTHHGAWAELVRRLQSATDDPMPRSAIERWLHANPARRHEPRYGAGALMIQVYRQMRAGWTGPVKGAKRKS